MPTGYLVKGIRVTTAVPDFEEIDAVELIGTGIPQAGPGRPDGVGYACDKCPSLYNPDQQDTDLDGVGDACECLGVTCAAPSDPCRVAPGVCDAATGSCMYPGAPDGTACDDANLCTRADACLAGVCSGQPLVPKVDCNDHNRCTDDSCDPERGCFHSPIVCRDGDPDTTDSCDPGRGCVFTRQRGAGPLPLAGAAGN
jgi:hypothetical protein